jgi:hypothetical protein
VPGEARQPPRPLSHEHRLAGFRQTDLLGRPGFELLDADHLQGRTVATGGYFVDLRDPPAAASAGVVNWRAIW